MTFNLRKNRFFAWMGAALAVSALVACSDRAASENGPPVDDQISGDADSSTDLAVGEEFQPCDGCPTFVRVPAAPDDMRSITHVAKFELTWNQYLVASDAGVCPLPIFTDRRFREIAIDPNSQLFQEFRRDYPVSNLGLEELNCYVEWLDEQTIGQVRLPSYSEWEWFARSGDPYRKYPWGNEEDPTREALSRLEVQDVLNQPGVNRVNNTRVSHIILGTRVGLFPPTEWGLYDVLGNVPELTSDVIVPSNIEVYRERLGIEINPISQNSRRRIIKGELLEGRSDNWREGISKTRFVREMDGGFSFTAGVRLVIEGQ